VAPIIFDVNRGMEPYFYKLKQDIVSKDLKDYIIDFTFNNLDKFISYKGKKVNYEDGNNFYLGSALQDSKEINKIIQSCSLDCFPVIMLHKPNTKVIKHIDDPNRRNCVLSIPLYPRLSYPPTWFWKEEGNFVEWQFKDSELLATCNFDDMFPAFLNTQEIHSLKTLDSYRINLQFCFTEPFEIVVEKYKKNKLFNLLP
jgi:hypothetical protein